MTRVKEIREITDAPSNVHKVINKLKDSYNGRIVGPYRVLLYKPSLAEVVCSTADQIRKETTLSPEVRELVTIIVAREIDCVYVWSAHQPGAIESGVPYTVVDSIEKNEPIDFSLLSEKQRIAVDFTLELIVNNRVSDQLFEKAQKTFGVEGVVDLASTIGQYYMLGCVLNSFEVDPDPDRPILSV
jgi:4-carboxymuconolactone decarboxylase